MQHETGSFDGLDGVTIFTQRWVPDDEPPRAVVMIAHGVGEHGGRYAHVAAHLTAHGYAVCALDHRGHGRSGGPRVVVADFDVYVADLRTYFERIRADFPDLPVVLYGHSMGSLISLLFAFRCQDDLAALITTGTALRLPLSNPVLAALIKAASAVIPSVRLISLDVTAISRDPAVVERYRDDPLVYHGALPVSILAAFARAVARCTAQLPALRLPYLALHGGADTLTRPAGAEMVRARSGSPDTTVTIYDGLFHEVHNEPEQGQVLDDITTWLADRVGRGDQGA